MVKQCWVNNNNDMRITWQLKRTSNKWRVKTFQFQFILIHHYANTSKNKSYSDKHGNINPLNDEINNCQFINNRT